MGSRDEAAKTLMKRINEAKGDWFKVLGLDIDDCTVDKVKAAYKKAVISLHPDKCKLDGAASAFSEADKAYKALKDPETIAKFQKAAKKKEEQSASTFQQQKSSLEQWLKKSRGGAEEAAGQAAAAAELTPEERERMAAEKARKEYIYATERKFKERQEREKRRVREREEDLYEEARLQNSVSQWKQFQAHGAKRTKIAPSMRQNVGAVRTSELKQQEHEPKADYKQIHKSWQDATR